MNTVWDFIPLWLMWYSYHAIAGSLRSTLNVNRLEIDLDLCTLVFIFQTPCGCNNTNPDTPRRTHPDSELSMTSSLGIPWAVSLGFCLFLDRLCPVGVHP